MSSSRFAALNSAAQWAALLVATVALSEAAAAAGFPAAYLLGAMLSGVAFGIERARIRVPRPVQAFSQGIIGCLVARSITKGVLITISQHWFAMLIVVSTTVAAAGLVGWALAKTGTVSGTTAAWGSSPGAASAMVLLSGEFGADIRLVAFMQYLRVLFVVVTASVAARILSEHSAMISGTGAVSQGIAILSLTETVVIAGVGAWIGRTLKIPTGALLVPMIIGALLQASGQVTLTLPPWLLHAAYAAVGWFVGLNFDRDVLKQAVAATPKLILSTLLLIGLCAVSATLLHRWSGIGPLTAYLATSPGGLDSVAAIAVGGGADIPFVLSMQTMRLLIVILTGPIIAKLISRYA